MSIKLIAMDMDGTVLRTDKSVSERTVGALKQAIAKGITVVPATGRIAKMVPKPILEIPGVRYAITSNGATVLDLTSREVLYSNLMSREESDQILSLLQPYRLLVEAYCKGVSYSDRRALEFLPEYGFPQELYRYLMESQIFVDDLPKFIAEKNYLIEKVNIPYVPANLRAKVEQAVLSHKEYSGAPATTINLEFNSADCSKGDGLLHLCERLSVRPEEVMAFGDAENDRAMLEFAGFSVAMGNGMEHIKRAADYVTAANDDDGVAAAIEKFVLRHVAAASGPPFSKQ